MVTFAQAEVLGSQGSFPRTLDMTAWLLLAVTTTLNKTAYLNGDENIP